MISFSVFRSLKWQFLVISLDMVKTEIQSNEVGYQSTAKLENSTGLFNTCIGPEIYVCMAAVLFIAAVQIPSVLWFGLDISNKSIYIADEC